MTSRRQISQVLLSTVFVMMLVAAGCSAQDSSQSSRSRRHPQPNEDGTICVRERREVVVEREGCEPRTTTVPYCNGRCASYQLVKAEFPFTEQECQCCRSTYHVVKVRRLKFNCGGRMVTHKFYHPRIEECHCTACF